MGGGTALGSAGGIVPVYGTQGTADPANTPGSRKSSVTWTDAKGNLWLFGGFADTPATYRYVNDLWMYNPSTNEWTWVNGSNTEFGFWGQDGIYGTLGQPAPGNIPPGRYGASGWSDSQGNLWIFGGWGCESNATNGFPDSCYYNDLWEFNPTLGQWAWMGGSNNDDQPGMYGTQGVSASTNIPGARVGSLNWTDKSGNFWLFGGYGYDANGALHYLNDLWKFSPSTGQWIWMSGTDKVTPALGQGGTYGTLGTPAQANSPGAREFAAAWTDTNGNLWMFGGHGVDGAGALGDLNDLWMFDTANSEWTWIGGGRTLAGYAGLPGTYASWMRPAAANYPGGRRAMTPWSDSNGNFWLYGGYGADSAGVQGELNDLWEYSPALKQWAWMGGNATLVPRSNRELGQLAVYGTLLNPDFENSPGGLHSALGWTDKSGNAWLYGGYGFDALGWAGYFNDLWVYQTSAGSLPAAATPSFSPHSGTYAAGQVVSISDATPGATVYHWISGAPAPVKYADPITVSATEKIDAVAVAPGYGTSAIASASYAVPQTAPPTFSLPAGTYADAQTVAISDSTPGAVIYYAMNQAPTTNSDIYSGPITVSASETIQAMAVAPGSASSETASSSYTIWPTSAVNQWAWMLGPGTGAPEAVPGALGVPSLANTPEGGQASATWTDKNGNFWLFGGTGFNGERNDLWKFTSSTNEWTWMGGTVQTHCDPADFYLSNCREAQPGVYGSKGTPARGNWPGARADAATWIDSGGNLWLFGGLGQDALGTFGLTVLNDLWKYNISTAQWTWISGSSTLTHCFLAGSVNCAEPSIYGNLGSPASGNTPGSRAGAIHWIDSKGNLWLFGGWSFDVPMGVQYYYDELWKLDPASNQWTWMGGSDTRDGSACAWNVNLYYYTCGEPGTYGTIVTPAPANIPGGRANTASWVDRSGNFWLFGGDSFDANGSFGNTQDVWEFTPSTNQWAWMGGNTQLFGCSTSYIGGGCSGPAVTGTLGVPAAGNIPQGGSRTVTWTDRNGNFWLFGSELNQIGLSANDALWEFTPSANEWTWMGNSGNSGDLQGAVYGTLRTPAAANGPGNHFGSASWTGADGSLWLFAGATPYARYGFDNNVWRYAPAAPAPVPDFAVLDWNDPDFYKTTTFTVPAGTSGTTSINTVVSNGFNSPISLNAAGLPAGVTATFSPSTMTGFGTSNLTVSADLATPPDNYTFTVTGTSAGVTRTTTVSVAITNAPPATFTLGSSAPSLTIKSGGSGQVKLTVTPQYGFNSAVSFSCSGLPNNATCAFSPVTVTPSGAAASTTLTISLANSSQSAMPRNGSTPFFPLTALAGGVCLFIFRRRRAWQQLALAVALGVLGLVSACGGGGSASSGGSGGGSTPLTYPITINASSGNLSQTANLSLTVN